MFAVHLFMIYIIFKCNKYNIYFFNKTKRVQLKRMAHIIYKFKFYLYTVYLLLKYFLQTRNTREILFFVVCQKMHWREIVGICCCKIFLRSQIPILRLCVRPFFFFLFAKQLNKPNRTCSYEFLPKRTCSYEFF